MKKKQTKKKQDKTTIYFTGLPPVQLEQKMSIVDPEHLIENPTCWCCGRDHLTTHASLRVSNKKEAHFLPQSLKVRHIKVVIAQDFYVNVPICEICYALFNLASQTKVSFFTQLRDENELPKDNPRSS